MVEGNNKTTLKIINILDKNIPLLISTNNTDEPARNALADEAEKFIKEKINNLVNKEDILSASCTVKCYSQGLSGSAGAIIPGLTTVGGCIEDITLYFSNGNITHLDGANLKLRI
jgi:hypothetical protein